MRFSHTLLIGALAASMALPAGAAEARQGVFKARGANGAVTAAKGPNGGTAVRARGKTTNADGSVTTGSAAAVRAPNGARAVRGSTTTANPDGSLTHEGGLAAEGAKGSVASTGAVSRSADGTWSGGRSTSATSASTGNSYQGSVSIDPATGQPTHSATCYDAAGTVIACPR